MSELAAFQDAFLQGVSRGQIDDDPPGLAVYRNTIWRTLAEALEAAYPAVARIVGPDWFGACAGVFVRAHPPRGPILARYGADFPEFLDRFPPAADLPFLAEVAAAERLWTESHLAADAPRLDPATADGLADGDWLDRPLTLHPATRFARFRFPVATLLRLNRAADTPDDAFARIAWEPEIVGLFRPEGEVRLHALDECQFALLQASSQGRPLGDALLAACELGADAAALATGLSGLCAAGAFAAEGPA